MSSSGTRLTLMPGDENGATPLTFQVFMATKKGSLSPFIIELGGGLLKIKTVSKSAVKKCIDLAATHVKLAKEVVCTPEAGKEEFKGSEDPLIWYPLKLMLSSSKSRLIFFESRRYRDEGLRAILHLQGFISQLD